MVCPKRFFFWLTGFTITPSEPKCHKTRSLAPEVLCAGVNPRKISKHALEKHKQLRTTLLALASPEILRSFLGHGWWGGDPDVSPTA